MPAATRKNVPRSIRNTLRTDHSMMRFSMSVPLVAGIKAAGGGTGAHRLYADDDVLAGRLLDYVEGDLLTRFQRPEQCRLPDPELHGHRRPLEAGDRAVGERYGGTGRIHRLDAALAAVIGGRGGCGGCAG